MARIELLGVHEMSRLLGVSRQRVSELAKQKRLPEPLAELQCGRIWDKADVLAWLATWRRTPGPKPKHDHSGCSSCSGSDLAERDH